MISSLDLPCTILAFGFGFHPHVVLANFLDVVCSMTFFLKKKKGLRV